MAAFLLPSDLSSLRRLARRRGKDALFCTTALWRTPLYPPVLDLLVQLAQIHEAPLLRAALDTVALPYESFLERSASARQCAQRSPRWDDAVEQDGTALEDFILNSICSALDHELPEGVTLVFHRPDLFDHFSLQLLARLLGSARRDRRHIICACSPAQFSASGLASIAGMPPTLDEWSDGATISPVQALPKHVTAALAAAGQAIPWSVAIALEPHLAHTHTPVFGMLLPENSESLAHAPADAALALFDAWAPAGYGYLQRALLLCTAGDTARFAEHYFAYFFGFMSIGRDFLYRYVTGWIAACESQPVADHVLVALNIIAARLAPRVRVAQAGYRASVQCYSQAIAGETDPERRAQLLYELANVHAVQRTPAALAEAESIYALACAALDDIDSDERRLVARVRIENGLALIDYHRHDDAAALAREQRTMDEVAALSLRYPMVSEWAEPLLRTNTAKLYSSRLHEPEKALDLLSANASTGSLLSQSRSRIEMAQILFDDGNWQGCIDALASLVDRSLDLSTVLEPMQSAKVDLLSAIALSRVGRQEEAFALLGRAHPYKQSFLAGTMIGAHVQP